MGITADFILEWLHPSRHLWNYPGTFYKCSVYQPLAFRISI